MQSGPPTHIPVSSQQGMAFIEVLVALVLFSVAALGYVGLQAQSLAAVDDAVMRTQALVILTEAAERIRTNMGWVALRTYQLQFDAATIPAMTSCTVRAGCNATQVVQNDVAVLRLQAKQQGMTLAMLGCPGRLSTTENYCLVAAWHGTQAKYVSSEVLDGCLHLQGNYRVGSDCLYMEAY